MEPTNVKSRDFRTGFVLLLVAAVTALFFAVIWPFLKPLLLGALLASLCRPLYRWVTRIVGGRPSLGAVLTLVILLVIVLGPLSALLGTVVAQAVSISNQAIPWLHQHFGPESGFNLHDWLVQRFPAIAEFLPDQGKLLAGLGDVAQAAGGFLVASASRMTAGTAVLLLNTFVMLYAMFFFFRDGGKILDKIFYYTPLDDEDEARVVQRFTSITRATIKGTLLIGLIQGTLAGVAFWVAGIDGAAFWGTIMTILSIIPGIGSALVWVPAVIYLFASGQPLNATLLLVWCATVVSTIDNVLRPSLVGKDARLPDLLILVGTLGGLFLFGPIGFIVGPIVCGLFLTVWEIYGTTFRSILPPVKGRRPPEVDNPEPAPALPDPKG